jgi:hypothetical protein
MIRKSVFWGLALVLAFVLVSIIIRGRRLEKKQSAKSVEIIQESPSTPTRVLMPKDLEVVQSKMRLEKVSDGQAPSVCAWHEMGIRNKEKISYQKIQLSIDYMDRRGENLVTKPYSVEKNLMAGNILQIADIKIEGLPAQTANCRIAIVYAEIETVPQPKQKTMKP